MIPLENSVGYHDSMASGWKSKPNSWLHGDFLKMDLILGQCPEDHIDVKRVTCQPNLTDCSATREKGPSESLKGFHKCRAQGTQCPQGKTIFKAHGPLTGYCVPSDR